MTKMQKWISAGKILAQDKNAVVTCPACDVGRLIVTDVVINEATGIDDNTLIDRYMKCNDCGAENVISRVRI